jgi:hypothetical protein
MNIIDMLAIIPFYQSLLLEWLETLFNNFDNFFSLQDPMNIIDMLAIIFFYISLLLEWLETLFINFGPFYPIAGPNEHY